MYAPFPSPSDCTPLEQWQALYTLWVCYVHMRAWGLPEYQQLVEQEREDFAAIVQSGELLERLESAKIAAVRAGVVPEDKESWLIPVGAIHDETALSQAVRDDLGRVTTAMWPYLVRLEAALTQSGDTRNKKRDKKKLSPRGFTPEARSCARLYATKRKADPKVSMKSVITEYIANHGGSFESIKKSLSAHPEEWKKGHKGDT